MCMHCLIPYIITLQQTYDKLYIFWIKIDQKTKHTAIKSKQNIKLNYSKSIYNIENRWK